MKRVLLRYLSITVGCAVLSACAISGPVSFSEKEGGKRTLQLSNLLNGTTSDRLRDPYVRTGILALEQVEYHQALTSFNKALKFEPDNSRLHFLTGLSYHLLAQQGDASRLKLAKVGYDLALRHDPANYWAAAQLGHIAFHEGAYKQAQDAFAYALLYAPDNVDFWHGLAVSSYGAQDIETALGAMVHVQEISAMSPYSLDDFAVIAAAAGRFEQAQSYQADYLKQGGRKNDFRARLVAQRLMAWKRLYDQNFELAQNEIIPQAQDEISTATDVATTGGTANKSSNNDAQNAKEMTLVDVVIVRSEERHSTSKGVNLLNGLSSTLSGTLWSMNDSRTVNKYGTNSASTTYTINPSFSLSATYSLNIFNDNYDRNEVLARPTLVALDNTKSEFFTGSVFHVELAGAAGSVGAVEKVPVGVRLEVTPKFLNNEEVQLTVAAGRAFIEGQSANAGFNNFTQVTQNSVSANVVMKFGDTLVLSGLSEKETQNLRDGVPLLQDIPLVQYLFSNENTLDYTKSVMILITPRKPNYTYRADAGENKVTSDRELILERNFLRKLKDSADWRHPLPNAEAAFYHLKDGSLFNAFRQGDVTLEKWYLPERLERMTTETLGFLYF
jgi:Flp pilus assembly protein TadD